MQFARIRTAADREVELVYRQPDGRLLRLAALDDSGTADPVALLARHDRAELTRLIGEVEEVDLLDPDEVLFEPPVATCTKICCLALNYRDHAEESGLEVPPEPVLFFKPPSALTGHRTPVVAPRRTRHLEHEVELAVVIGTPTRDLPAERWLEAVAGYTIINDMTARDLQLVNHRRNVPWDQAKGFDTFAPVGPYLVTSDEVDPSCLDLRLEVDGALRQQANTRQMVHAIPQLIADLSDGMTLFPGDIIATGTTAGLAPLADGDTMRATITSLGTLENPVVFT